MNGLLLRLALFMLLGVLPACASSAPSREARPVVLPAPLGEAEMERARQAPIIRGDGTATTRSELLEACMSADAVVIAERHGFGPGLAGAAALWGDMLGKPGDFLNGAYRPALALEFWERDHQIRLDDYLQGVTDEAGLFTAMGWTGAAASRAEQSFPPGHRAMVNAAKERGVPVIAANAPRRYVRLARTDGFDRLGKLTEGQQRLFRLPGRLIEGRYRDDFERIMGGDPANPGHQAIYRSQQMWDWTMAESVANAVDRGNRPVVLVVGAFHAEHDGGLLQALREIRPGTKVLTVSFLDSTKTEVPIGGAGTTPGNVDRGPRADFVVDFAR
ncbi:MAG: ChaN family lipoprotein [Phycisphaerales bacterium]